MSLDKIVLLLCVHISFAGDISYDHGSTSSGTYSYIGGGQNHTATNTQATVAGGNNNDATGTYATVAGGDSNIASGSKSVIGGGGTNSAEDSFTAVLGGSSNNITGTNSEYSAILGGFDNGITGAHSSVLGGRKLSISGDHSIGFNGDSSSSYAISGDSIAAFLGVKMGIGVASPDTAFHYKNSAPAFRAQDTDGGGAASVYFEFGQTESSNWSRTGWFGDGSSSVRDIRLQGDGFHTITLCGEGRNCTTLAPTLEAFGPSVSVVYNGTLTSTYAFVVGGSAYSTTNVWTGSDERLKRDISGLDGALSKIQNLRGVSYKWKAVSELATHVTSNGMLDLEQIRRDGASTGDELANIIQNVDHSSVNLGFIAQEVATVIPEAVKLENNGVYSMSYAAIIPVLVEAVKELKNQNDSLKNELESIKEKIALISQ